MPPFSPFIYVPLFICVYNFPSAVVSIKKSATGIEMNQINRVNYWSADIMWGGGQQSEYVQFDFC